LVAWVGTVQGGILKDLARGSKQRRVVNVSQLIAKLLKLLLAAGCESTNG
jgi:hypothetical protein